MYNQPLPKLNKPNFSISLILILLLFLLIGAIGGYYLGSNKITQPSNPPDQQACTMEAKLCPNGTSVGRVPPNCDFTPCPSTQPTASPNETANQAPDGNLANWKTYRNKKYGFEFRYPPDWISDCDIALDCITSSNFVNSISDVKSEERQLIIKRGAVFTIQVKQQSQFTDPYEICKNDTRASCSATIIANLNAAKRAIELPNMGFIYYVYSNDNLYILSAYYDHTDRSTLQIFDQILSSFKFTD